jgi:hypothetical protein
LCNDPSNTFNFVNNPDNFQGYIKSTIALTTVYLYSNNFDTANAGYYNTFKSLTGWDASYIQTMVHNP